MAAQIVHWVLSASGVLLFGWCMFGWLLIPASDDTVTVIFVSQTQKMEHDVRLWLWLKLLVAHGNHAFFVFFPRNAWQGNKES